MFRLNRIKPHGRSTPMNSRSASFSSVPDTPVMKARVLMARRLALRWPRGQQGSRKRPLIPLDDALPAGGLQAAAELRGFVGRAERADHVAVIDTSFAKISALADWRARSQHGRELALQRPEGSL